jgi:hypothetical protein
VVTLRTAKNAAENETLLLEDIDPSPFSVHNPVAIAPLCILIAVVQGIWRSIRIAEKSAHA